MRDEEWDVEEVHIPPLDSIINPDGFRRFGDKLGNDGSVHCHLEKG